MDSNACVVSPTQTCLYATSSAKAQATVKQLCGAYGVRQAAVMLCLSLKINKNTCAQVGAMAVQYFGAGKEPQRCAVEAAKMSGFCSALSGALQAGSACDALVSCTDSKAPADSLTGFTCSACPAGYKGDAKAFLPGVTTGCQDVDDCAAKGKATCGSKGVAGCKDAGTLSYKCACTAGYVSAGNNKRPTCQFIDACKAAENDCVKGAKCNHLASGGKHSCTCPQARPALLGPWDTFQGPSQTRMRHAAC